MRVPQRRCDRDRNTTTGCFGSDHFICQAVENRMTERAEEVETAIVAESALENNMLYLKHQHGEGLPIEAWTSSRLLQKGSRRIVLEIGWRDRDHSFSINLLLDSPRSVHPPGFVTSPWLCAPFPPSCVHPRQFCALPHRCRASKSNSYKLSSTYMLSTQTWQCSIWRHCCILATKRIWQYRVIIIIDKLIT